MACKPICQLCKRFIISQSVTFAGGNLVINLPAGSYQNCEKYCIVIAQAIPAATTINAPVVVTVGTGTQQYPLVGQNCRPVTACSVRTRTRYSTCVETTATSAVFRLLGKPCCAPNNNLTAVNGTAPVAAAAADAGGETPATTPATGGDNT